MLQIGILGASGRMGRNLIDAVYPRHTNAIT